MILEKRLHVNKQLRYHRKRLLLFLFIGNREVTKELANCYLVDLEVDALNPQLMEKEARDAIWDDNLHFTPHGYDLLAEHIHKVLAPIL